MCVVRKQSNKRNAFPYITAAAAAEESSKRGASHRTYRLEKTNAVTSGKWYFEMEVLTSGPMRVGWMETCSPPGTELGCDDKSWAFDGFRVSTQSEGPPWPTERKTSCVV